MSKQREALQLALETLENLNGLNTDSMTIWVNDEIEFIEKALAEPIDPMREAAPDLLEALELMVDTYDNGGWPSSTLVIARAAIDKAKGEV